MQVSVVEDKYFYYDFTRVRVLRVCERLLETGASEDKFS